MDVTQLGSGLIEDVAEPHPHGFQVGCELLVLGRRQGLIAHASQDDPLRLLALP